MSTIAPAKDFLSILDLSTDELIRLIEAAARIKSERGLGHDALDPDRAALEVNVAPPQGKQLARPRAGLEQRPE